MKQTKIIFLLPAIELLGVIVPQENIHHLAAYVQLELVVICLCGYFGMKQSMFLLMCVWAIWALTTNFNVIQEYAQIEAGVFASLVFWIYRRPEWIPSDPPSDTVQIAFYYGDKSPFVAKLMAMLGLNVTGIAVIVGDEAYVPVGKSGRVEKRTRKALRKWIKLDTGVGSRHNALEGKNVDYAGCMKAFKDVLIEVITDWSPLDTPSSLMSKMLARRK